MSKITLNDIQNPLYLHPSDRPSTIVVEKLQGAADYRAWKRSMEIALASKRKLGFVTGLIARDPEDKEKQEQWDTCNHMIIAWLLFNVSESIKRSVMFCDSARSIWKQLEQSFSVVNGSRKYRLNKELYEFKQKESSVSEYYTGIKILWEELESMVDYPPITNMNPEIGAFIKVLETEREEQKLFQFLNGLNEVYSQQRNQMLMKSPLPTVEEACSILQQEESQRDVLTSVKLEPESSAMYGKGNPKSAGDVCSACGVKGHTAERCWTIIGYPRWHPKSKQNQKGKSKESTQGNMGKNPRKPTYAQKTAANVQGASEDTGGSGITLQQLEHLIKNLPLSQPQSSVGGASETDEELDFNYAGMVLCNGAMRAMKEWIIDSRASDHMTGDVRKLENPVRAEENQRITLPNGKTAKVTHVGKVRLSDKLELKNVLFVPEFQHNLLSVSKLAVDDKCKVEFHPKVCAILDKTTHEVKGLGNTLNGLYYLVEETDKKPPAPVNGDVEWIECNGEETVEEHPGDVEQERTTEDSEHESETELTLETQGSPQSIKQTSEDATERVPRRSERTHKQPEWLKDYEVHKKRTTNDITR
ncbi:Retrovirus-related Pol polyprotein from transposon RE1, partial [Bienertia sinuspersici]